MSKIRQPETGSTTILYNSTLFLLHMFPSHGYRIKFSFPCFRISKLESFSLGRTFVLPQVVKGGCINPAHLGSNLNPFSESASPNSSLDRQGDTSC